MLLFCMVSMLSVFVHAANDDCIAILYPDID